MRDKGIWKILADSYPLMETFEDYFALLEAVQVTKKYVVQDERKSNW